MRKALFAVLVAVVTVLAFAPGAQASSNLKCFGTESGSTCTADKNGSFILSNNTSQYSGVYIPGQGFAGKLLSSVSALQFNYDGAISGGSPRFSLSVIDSTGRDGYLFIDAASCNMADVTTSPSSGLVSPLVDTTCVVSGYYYNVDGSTDSFYYSSWQDFLNSADGQGAKFFTNNLFVIADQAGTVTVSNIKVATSSKK